MSARNPNPLGWQGELIENQTRDATRALWAFRRAGLDQSVLDELAAGHIETAVALLKADRDNAIEIVRERDRRLRQVWITHPEAAYTMTLARRDAGYERALEAVEEEQS